MNKRLEIYVTFKCNNNCLFCVEKENRHKFGNKVLFTNDQEIEQKLLEYKNQGYNHLNFLGGEPFMAKNIIPLLQIAKKLNFQIALATNGYFLADNNLAQQTLPLIDDLIISIHGHNQDLINKQSQNQGLYDKLLLALDNIKQYFRGRLLKANCVINKLNYKDLLSVLKFINKQGINEVNFTSLIIKDYNQDLIVQFNQLKLIIEELVKFSNESNMIIRFSDLPLCVLGDNYHLANHLFFEPRDKYYQDGAKDKNFLRQKVKPKICNHCEVTGICQGIDEAYFNLFQSDDLTALKK